MTRLIAILPLLAFASVADSAPPATETKPPTIMAERGKELFADDFERAELGSKWRAGIPKVTIKDGTMVGEELPEKMHAAVAKTAMPYASIVADFDFRLEGSKRFNFVMDDKTYKGSHAGHIARVTFSANGVNLGDSKTGVMANENYDNKDKPEFKEKLAAIRKATESIGAVKIEQGKWYHATVEILGDEGVVSVDGKPIAYLTSPGLSHSTKDLLGFSISGQVGLIDNLKVWEAKATPDLDKRRADLKAKLSK